jgi:hypothetical protein
MSSQRIPVDYKKKVTRVMDEAVKIMFQTQLNCLNLGKSDVWLQMYGPVYGSPTEPEFLSTLITMERKLINGDSMSRTLAWSHMVPLIASNVTDCEERNYHDLRPLTEHTSPTRPCPILFSRYQHWKVGWNNLWEKTHILAYTRRHLDFGRILHELLDG